MILNGILKNYFCNDDKNILLVKRINNYADKHEPELNVSKNILKFVHLLKINTKFGNNFICIYSTRLFIHT